MSICAGLRFASRRTNSGQAKLIRQPKDARYFSQRTSSLRPTRRPDLSTTRLRSTQQTRSLSLFGWGSSKSPDDFTKIHSPTATTSSSQTVDSPAPPQVTTESIRTVKASHSTSDAPEPNSTSTVEADALQGIETSVLQTQNATSAAATTSDGSELASIPEGIGYLKDVCGLDFGWGPTTLMQFLLEHVHITAGLSWSVSILVLPFLIRGAIYPFVLRSSDMNARFQEVAPALKTLREKTTEALANNDRTTAMETRMQMREMNKEAGLSFVTMLMPMLLQIPLGYGAWHILRTAAVVPVPAFETEHFLWLTNIATGDPWYILPLVTALLTYTNLNTSMQAQSAPVPGMIALKNLLPLVTGGFLAFQPGAVQLYFIVNGILTQIQMSSLQNHSFRRWIKLHPLPNRDRSAESATPFSRMNISDRVINTTARKTSPSSPNPVVPPSAPATNSSFIDKGVDSLKELGRKAIGSTNEKAQAKIEKRKRAAQSEAAERYEAQRQQDIQNQRAYRNAQRAQSPRRRD
ncbi:hypothetical protein H2200_000760 [Cladophialophora chaetospira]|uniref:Membrane insertase YidC/Oxa/ALB C-terminal domain-containing protein n=1 Tax=Cladophialophora chaetospira TaxID=386627 RepID=A0AA38XQ41_9EURO|nr:hypothetical protein H2200_000760 [Cladophialophora chaetospira]